MDSFEADVKKLVKRYHHKAYKVKEYHDLSDEYRKILLDDFSETMSLCVQIAATSPNGWRKGRDEEFLEGFKPYWLSTYLLSQYTLALGSNSTIDTFLNDSHGGNKGMLADLRDRMSHPKNASRLVDAYTRAMLIKEGRAYVKEFAIRMEAFMVNARKLLKYRLFHWYLPFQIAVAKVLPNKYWFWKKKLYIRDAQMDDMEPFLRPGDVLLQRTNYKMTNMTLPGFWTHTMLYDGKGHIIEATPGKVRKVSWRKTVHADYVCVLRPSCSEDEKAAAINFATKQVGKEYDFSFDFLSDDALVCSELVLKSYPFLKPTLKKMLGHRIYPSSNFIDLYNEGLFSFVYFLDGRQHTMRAILGTPEELGRSHLRSKWDIVQK